MTRPNIVFVFADQLRHSAMGVYGNPVVKTPHFDRLAGQGVVFDNAFSNCPICSPYRAQILTGLYPHRNGMVCNEYRMRTDVETLPGLLKEAGYRTGFVGKWHLGRGPYPEEKRYGFDYLAGYNCPRGGYFSLEYFENEEGPHVFDKWGPEAETDRAIRFIDESREAGEPFLLMMGWAPPHWPYGQFPEEHDVYDPATVDLPENVPRPMAAFARQEIAQYYGNVSALDAQMGRLMTALDEMGLAEDTIVCFSSDHGDHLSSHGYGKPGYRWMHRSKCASKATPYEESIHIPFILRWPGKVAKGERTALMFGSVDVAPTLLGLCDLAVPESMQGTNLSEEILGKDASTPDSVYLQILGPGWPSRRQWVGLWRGVRTDGWVYARWHDDEYVRMLFDIENDPYQMKNLAYEADYADRVEAMEGRLKQWIEETGDPFDTGERDPETKMLLLGQEFADDNWPVPFQPEWR